MDNKRHQSDTNRLNYSVNGNWISPGRLVIIYFAIRPIVFVFLIFFVGVAWGFLFWALIWISMSLTPYSRKIGQLMLGTINYESWKSQLDRLGKKWLYKTAITIIDPIHVIFAIVLFFIANIRAIDFIR
jgi:hypothetical protein